MKKSKVHFKETCTRSWTGVETTTDMAKVTCKSCLKFVNKRREYPDVPTFTVIGEDNHRRRRRMLRFTCPICGQVNVHSGAFGQSGAADGHRSAHCVCWRPDGYVVREALNEVVL